MTIILRARWTSAKAIGETESTQFKFSKKFWKLAKWKWINLDKKNVSMRKRACEIVLVKRIFKWLMLESSTVVESSFKVKRPPNTWAEMKLRWTRVTKANQKVCGWHQRKPKIPADDSLWKNGVPPVTRKNQKTGDRDRKRSFAIDSLGTFQTAMKENKFLCPFADIQAHRRFIAQDILGSLTRK